MAARTASGTGPRPAGSRDPGRGVLAAVRRRPLAAFFLLAYLISWGYWVPVAAAGGHLSHFPGLLGPMLAAFAVSAVVAGRAGVADLLRRMASWRVPVRWYAAVLVPLAAAAAALAVASAFGAMPSLDRLSRMPGLPAAGWFAVLVLAFLVNGYGEETGWRGFAWPRLRERHGLAGAALLLTGPWALWHLPTFWLDTGLRGFAPVMVPGFLVGMAAGAVVLGWLYERTRGSVLVVALWHAALNMASATEGTEDVAAAATAVVIVWAVLILRAERRRTAATAGEGAVAGPLGR
jgi:membrane protease YdiL (CAAX protease family)